MQGQREKSKNPYRRDDIRVRRVFIHVGGGYIEDMGDPHAQFGRDRHKSAAHAANGNESRHTNEFILPRPAARIQSPGPLVRTPEST